MPLGLSLRNELGKPLNRKPKGVGKYRRGMGNPARRHKVLKNEFNARTLSHKGAKSV